tara:strand:+ start:2031 stop:3299 length:1269 start_codon:yes stop_codon:yes gene_type:complete
MIEGWKQITIGDLGQVVTGNTPPKKDPANYGGKYPFIKPTDMDIDRRHVTEWEENYSEKAFKRYHRSYIPPKATGVVTIGTVGEKIFQADKWCFTNQSVNVVIPDEELYDPDFVYFLLKVNLPKVLNANPGTASGRHHVSKSNFCAIKILVPESKETQRKIATILSAYDDLIENNLKRIKLLEEKAQLTYEEWFVRMKFPGHKSTPINEETGLPEGWKQEKFDKNFTLSNGYAFKSSDYQTSGVKILRTKDYSQTKWVNIDQPIFLSNEKADQYQKYYVRPYDLMLIMVGASIGNYGIILPRDTGILQNQNQWAIRAKNEHLNFFKILMMENLIQKLLGKKTGAARDFFRASFLKEIELNMPSELTLIQFNNNIKPLYESINNLFIQIDNLKEVRDILLPRLMTGMIDVEQMNLETLKPTTA